MGSAFTVGRCQIVGVPREALNWRPLPPAAAFDAACCDPTEQEQEHRQQD